MQDDIKIIDSPLQQTYLKNGQSVNIQIYRLENTDWTLEIVDPFNNSTVWNDSFKTDALALEEAFKSLESEGIDAYIDQPK